MITSLLLIKFIEFSTNISNQSISDLFTFFDYLLNEFNSFLILLEIWQILWSWSFCLSCTSQSSWTNLSTHSGARPGTCTDDRLWSAFFCITFLLLKNFQVSDSFWIFGQRSINALSCCVKSTWNYFLKISLILAQTIWALIITPGSRIALRVFVKLLVQKIKVSDSLMHLLILFQRALTVVSWDASFSNYRHNIISMIYSLF